MVIENFFSSFENESQKRGLYFAVPFSRISAFCLDFFVVIWPLCNLFSFLGNSFLIFFLCMALYEAFCLSLYEKTLGQLIMGLYTVDEEGRRLSFCFGLVRGLFSAVNVAFVFLPSLRIFKDSQKRQTFQDKVANSLVLSHSKNRESDYYLSSSSLKSLSYCLVFAISFLWIFLFMIFMEERERFSYKRELASFKKNAPLKSFCDEVKKESSFSLEGRLKKSLFLFDENKISRRCLKKEVAASFCDSSLKDLSYLAHAFIYKNESKVSRQYLKQACSLFLKERDYF